MLLLLMKIFKVKIYFFQSLKPKNPRPAGEIKRVSRILRKRCRKQKKSKGFDYKTDYYQNYWKYCQRVLEPESNKVKRTFNKNTC